VNLSEVIGMRDDEDEMLGPVISKYTARDAVEDGICGRHLKRSQIRH
jgi:hypothetical protein